MTFLFKICCQIICIKIIYFCNMLVNKYYCLCLTKAKVVSILKINEV